MNVNKWQESGLASSTSNVRDSASLWNCLPSQGQSDLRVSSRPRTDVLSPLKLWSPTLGSRDGKKGAVPFTMV